jgi:hypothetical protein
VSDPTEPRPSRARLYAGEAVVGLVIAGVLLWVAVASKVSVPFIYQGH